MDFILTQLLSLFSFVLSCLTLIWIEVGIIWFLTYVGKILSKKSPFLIFLILPVPITAVAILVLSFLVYSLLTLPSSSGILGLGIIALLNFSIIIFGPAVAFSWKTAIDHYKKLLARPSLDTNIETAATETQPMPKLVIKYFLLNVLLNVITTPIITFLFAAAYIEINPPTTALFIEPLLIPLFFSFPYVFFVVSLFSTIILIKREAFLSIDKKLLMLYVNLTLPLFLFFLTLVVMPYYSEQQAKQRAQQQKEDKENARIEIINKYSRNLNVSQCREEVIPAFEDYYKFYFPQWFNVNCVLDIEEEGNYHVKGSIKEFDQNGVEQIQPITGQVLIDKSEGERLGYGADEYSMNLTPGKHQLIFKLLTPPLEIRYYLLTYKFYIKEGKSSKGWVMNLPLKESTYTSKKYDLTKYPYKVID